MPIKYFSHSALFYCCIFRLTHFCMNLLSDVYHEFGVSKQGNPRNIAKLSLVSKLVFILGTLLLSISVL